MSMTPLGLPGFSLNLSHVEGANVISDKDKQKQVDLNISPAEDSKPKFGFGLGLNLAKVEGANLITDSDK